MRDPNVRDWLVSDVPANSTTDGVKGQTIDLSVPEARAWAQRELERILKGYHLGMLEHDEDWRSATLFIVGFHRGERSQSTQGPTLWTSTIQRPKRLVSTRTALKDHRSERQTDTGAK